MGVISGLNSLAAGIKDVRDQRLRWSERLAAGGAEAPWSTKTADQIDVSITTTNQISRLKSFEKSNSLVESRLKTQLSSIDDFMKLAKEIRTEFMPGRYTLGGVKPGFAASLQNLKDKFHSIGNRIDSVSQEYAMGGVATQIPPINAVGTFTGSVASDYSTPVNGAITAYINDAGDTISLSGNDFDTEVAQLYQAIMQLDASADGCDASADAASATAATAHQSLLTKYYQKLDQINVVNNEDEKLSSLIQRAIELKEEVTEDSIESLLTKVTSLSVMEDIRQHLYAQQSRKAQDAAAMLNKG